LGKLRYIYPLCYENGEKTIKSPNVPARLRDYSNKLSRSRLRDDRLSIYMKKFFCLRLVGYGEK